MPSMPVPVPAGTCARCSMPLCHLASMPVPVPVPVLVLVIVLVLVLVRVLCT